MTEKGYHLKEIPKGTVGSVSKIEEEFLEFLDAHEQKCKVIELTELSDLMGSIDLYLEREYNGTVKIEDLFKMAKITQRAFRNGDRN